MAPKKKSHIKHYKIYPSNRLEGRILKFINKVRSILKYKPLKTIHILYNKTTDTFTVNYNSMLPSKLITYHNTSFICNTSDTALLLYKNLPYHHVTIKIDDKQPQKITKPKSMVNTI